MKEARVIDAMRFPRRIQPGCMHQLGCKCDPPYWLREPTEQEFARWVIPRDERVPRDEESTSKSSQETE